ncbi:hypothetical protein LDENG_00218110 [Lucifuga dentata]|nr:hypothetical protein LDENG_00218110 [Lucifuga dentata]
MLSHTDLEKVIHTLIFSRLDYCNSILSGINRKSLYCLQLVQNAAARLLTAHLGLAPSYITEMLTPYEPVRSLRSSSGTLLAVPKSRLKSKGDRAFAIRAPRLWNDLSEETNIR